MARGWESKSVEEQMADAAAKPTARPGAPLTTLEARRNADQNRATRERQKQALNLQRESILSQRTSNPVRRAALEAALTQVEAQIAELG
jgi:hypothetical protein